MSKTKLYTIGFTQKKAETFFSIIKENEVKQVIDIRLNNVSQLAGFAKKDDLSYFLHELCNVGYRHEPLLAPTKEILDGYIKKKIEWAAYEKKFIELLKERNARMLLKKKELLNACFLCSEPLSDNCHRRLVAEYFGKQYKSITIIHL